MDRAINAWTNASSTKCLNDTAISRSLKLPYTVYGCMLLLSSNAFSSPTWSAYEEEQGSLDFNRLYELICHHLKVTHIAINKPIPIDNSEESENIVRSPINFKPLYGDFGPATASSPPTTADFDAAFWVTAKQNGIFQTWGPRWTMFSRGNISEKARLLTLPSVKEAVEQGKLDGRGSAAVDLYAGIGYFAFSYLKAGVERVLCWDLNPWSIEGLSRGAAANKWSVASLHKDSSPEDLVCGDDARLLVFNESNEHALTWIQTLRTVPPIRHVNCGLLPTSRGSWRTAIRILDRKLGGWLHIHENFAVAEIEEKADDVCRALQILAEEDGRIGTVKVEHVNRLKSYAPGVTHCVIDVHIPSRIPDSYS